MESDLWKLCENTSPRHPLSFLPGHLWKMMAFPYTFCIFCTCSVVSLPLPSILFPSVSVRPFMIFLNSIRRVPSRFLNVTYALYLLNVPIWLQNWFKYVLVLPSPISPVYLNLCVSTDCAKIFFIIAFSMDPDELLCVRVQFGVCVALLFLCLRLGFPSFFFFFLFFSIFTKLTLFALCVCIQYFPRCTTNRGSSSYHRTMTRGPPSSIIWGFNASNSLHKLLLHCFGCLL